MPTPQAPLALACTAAALLLAGCGSGDKRTATTTGATPAATPTAAPSTGGVPAVANARDLSSKPTIAKPQGAPPARLVKRDLVVGKGPAVRAGQLATVQYVGVSWSTGQEFDASWNRGQPFSFPLGRQQVIAGWDEGVAGMRVGGRRELVIPPAQAYGPQGSPPTIGPDETLVFVVDLTRIG